MNEYEYRMLFEPELMQHLEMVLEAVGALPERDGEPESGPPGAVHL